MPFLNDWSRLLSYGIGVRINASETIKSRRIFDWNWLDEILEKDWKKDSYDWITNFLSSRFAIYPWMIKWMKKVEICTTEWSLSILGKNKGIYGKIRLIGASESTRSRRIAINEFENNCRVPGDRYIQIETERSIRSKVHRCLPTANCLSQ